ncbi:MAG TPA: hypothetical protein GX707_15755 [Epulopiscium sp.]|nr:hypothetical protein [Candidatus Epulonipiscium sp.]
MKQIDKIKMLIEILEENVEMLEEYPKKQEEWENKRDEYIKQHGGLYRFYGEYPTPGTSQSHINDIARLIRKELLKI